MDELQVEIYLTRDGRAPFLEWFESLKDKNTVARIEARLARIRSGNLGDHHSLGEGLFELRMHFGSGFRTYFAREGNRIILLLNGGGKSTQDTDIKRAKRYYQDYLARKDE